MKRSTSFTAYFLLLGILASAVNGAILFDTDFETCPVGTGNDFPCEGWDDFKQEHIGAMEVVSGGAFTGSKFMRHFSNGPGNTAGGNTYKPSIYHKFSYPDHYFMRVAIRHSTDFQVCDNGHTKLIRVRAGGAPNLWVYNRWGSYALVMEAPYDIPGTYVLQTSIAPTKGGWDQVEVEWKLNTPGQSNGHVRFWINGALRAEQLNKAYRGPTDSSLCGNGGNLCSSNSIFESIQVYNQCMLGTVDYDRIALGDTRIGCAIKCDTLAEYNPPVISQQVPASGATVSDLSTAISFRLTDKTGVKVSSIVLQVNNVVVQPAISASSPTDVTVTYNPPKPFLPGSTIGIKVDAEDVLGNKINPQAFYTFKTASASIHASGAPFAKGPALLLQAVGRPAELIVNTPREGFADLQIVDVRGHCVGRASPQMLRAGSNKVQIDYEWKALGKGLYFAVLKQEKIKSILPLMIMQ